MRKAARLLAVTALALGASACRPHTVPSGFVGVEALWGAVEPEAKPEGLYWVYPGKSIIDMDARIQKKEVSATASSKDLQVVTAVIALNYRLQGDKAPQIYQDLGVLQTVESTIIDPVLQEAVKTATARYNAEELITKRREVKDAIAAYVKERLTQSNLNVTDLSIVNFQFDTQYQEAIERKQVAEQKALTATNDLKRIEVEAKQQEARAQGQANAMLIEARAEAERQNLLRKTLTPELVQWHAIQKWDGKMPVVQGEGSAAVVDVASMVNKAGR
jgi:regulator of protease activity HflC (stomatin/prohibitin superfamily)